jgi:hypothetical protein
VEARVEEVAAAAPRRAEDSRRGFWAADESLRIADEALSTAQDACLELALNTDSLWVLIGAGCKLPVGVRSR